MSGSHAALFLISLMLPLVGAAVYVGLRTGHAFDLLLPRWGRRCWTGFVLMMTALSAASVALKMPAALETAAACWMGIFLYLLLFALFFHLLGFAASLKKPAEKDRIRLNTSACALIMAALVSIYGFINAATPRHVGYSIGGGEQTHIVLISDLHLGAVGSERRFEKTVREINALSPDIICIAGDIFDSDFRSVRDPDRTRELFLSLNAPVYACLGNHDAGSTAPLMLDFLESAGVRVLAGEYEIINDRFALFGRADGSPIGGAAGIVRDEHIPVVTGIPMVVMDHNPSCIGEYDGIADLVLCGHTHHGQVFPGQLITGSLYACDYGYYKPSENAPHVIVTSGAGTWGPPMRVGTSCEIVTILYGTEPLK